MKTGVIIQARNSSTRLPAKVSMELPVGSGLTVIEQVARRAMASKEADEVIIATSTNKEDDTIEELFWGKGIPVFRGSLENVLQRYYDAATKHKIERIVRITGDCPLIDPGIIDLAINRHIETNADFTTLGALERTFPIGMDASVFNYEALERAFREAEQDHEKEHVTTFFYKSRPGEFRIESVSAPEKYYDPSLRLTLDTSSDYALINIIYGHLYAKDPLFGLGQIMGLINKNPWIREINSSVSQKKIHTTFKSELKELLKLAELHELKRSAEWLQEFIKSGS